MACTAAGAGALYAEVSSDAEGTARRGNVLALRKSTQTSPNHTPAVEAFAKLAAARNVDALFNAFDDVSVRANGELAIKHYLISEVVPFFADYDHLDPQMRVTPAAFEDGTTGHMAYGYIVGATGQPKPFVVAWRSESATLRVMDVQVGRCIKARHPVAAGRCDS
jgi:hypothetical protein